jgi:hypothetical protein
MQKRSIALSFIMMLAVFLTVASTSIAACPFCPSVSITLAEEVAQADAVVLVQWVRGTKPTESSKGNTTFEIKQIHQNFKNRFAPGDKLVLPRFYSGLVGNLFLLFGEKVLVIDWCRPIEISELSFNYMAQSPSPEIPTVKRLQYFAKFLEYPDELIANDAFSEFANASYEDVTAIADKIPADKIRKWLQSDNTPPIRLGFYGLLMGLSGNAADAKAAKAKILDDSQGEFRLGIDGLISGYLLMTGAKGLDVIDEHKIKNRDIAFSETYAALQALRFMWRYGDGRIEKARLRQSMRHFLERPELTDIVIADLARWKDWGIQDKLMNLYGKDEFDIPGIKRAIVRYMLVCAESESKNGADGKPVELPKHVTKARLYLENLRKRDPKTVASAERFFLLM